MTSPDIRQLDRMGISRETVEAQLRNFRTGFPYLRIIAPATPERGIRVLSEAERQQALEQARLFDGGICKFVPASGAATRMFKDLFEAQARLAGGGRIEPGSPAARYVENIRRFPFFDAARILQMTLSPQGLGYGSLPKGLIEFHAYPDGNRTPFEEHLVEGALYARSSSGTVRMTATVSEEHLEGFRRLFEAVREKYERRFSCRYDLAFTVQSPSTDVIAADAGGAPFRKADGRLLFRPGGHGALLKNLNDISSDIIVIKNIDNVVKESWLGETVAWKKILIGTAVRLREEIAGLLHRWDREEASAEGVSEALLERVRTFLREEFCVEVPDSPAEGLRPLLRRKLDRPVRVCGMVRNSGEPGGGPFLISHPDGTTSLQILEAAQIDLSDPHAAAALKQSTHFNPVDLVCAVKNYKGEKFDLFRFRDPATGFISEKSYEGKILRAQELPGLWNGAMSDWNTQFVEVPLVTFNPVKTVLDLLRPAHDTGAEE